MSTTEKKVYMKRQLYAVIESADEVTFRLDGICGGILHNVPHRDIGAVVGYATTQPDFTTYSNIMKYSEVVERLAEYYTVLPARFLTLFEGDANVASALERNYASLKDNLNRVKGKLEFGIRALWDDDTFLRDTGATSSVPSAVSGRDYMYAKAEGYRWERMLKEKADSFISVINLILMEVASQTRVENGSGRLFLNAAYLVENEKATLFKDAFGRMQSSFPSVRFLMSGPWPPYNFTHSF